MALLRDSASRLRLRADRNELHTLLADRARWTFDAATGRGEVRSWEMSLPALLGDLHTAGLDHVEVLLEHKLPYSPKRVDALLCGVHPRTRQPSYVVVELKQWTAAESVGENLVVVPGYGRQPVLHPAEQVRRYCQHLADFVPALSDRGAELNGIAYLHNATAEGWKLRRYQVDEYGRLFTRDQRGEFLDALTALLDTAPDSQEACRGAADRLLQSRVEPSKELMALAADEVRVREQFVLLDEQAVAYKTVEKAVEEAADQNTKTVVIVLGGPGSGKSVVALSLLGSLGRRGHRVMHATGSSAFTTTLRKLVVGARAPRAQQVFVYFNSFIGERRNQLDVLICDEAHRIRETSVNRFTRADQRAKAKQQVSELIDIARTPVFLLDEHQVVRPGEMGTEAEIRRAAHDQGCQVEVVRLSGQYRCGGSQLYDQWILRLLGLSSLPPVRWADLVGGTDETYEVAALPSPESLESWIDARRSGTTDTSRLAAGYCWRWSDPVTSDGTKVLVDDVVIGTWRRPWNAKPEKSVPGVPPSHLWASDPRGFGQVGCIYTAQGFEYDWSGVIFGNDLVRRGGVWVAQPEHSHDGQVKRASSGEFPSLIRNTYKVLLTRGMKATAIHSVDPETQRFLEEFTA